MISVVIADDHRVVRTGLEQLVGTFRVKRPNGYSGGPCTAGSTEYVAYWADFGEDCEYTYLGTAEVRTHDFDKLPKGGLCYAAPLPGFGRLMRLA